MVLLAIELVLVGIALLVVGGVAMVYVRRRMIGHNSDVVLCGFRAAPHGRYRPGLLRMSSTSLQVYPLFGWTSRATETWMRRSLDVPGAEPVDHEGGLSALLGQNTLRVHGYGVSETGDRRALEIVITPVSYTALRYWVEASPPSTWPMEG